MARTQASGKEIADGSVKDADLEASIARDSEVTTAVGNHASLTSTHGITAPNVIADLASATAAGTAAGTISGAAAGTISGDAAGTAAGTISGAAAGTVSGDAAGTAAGTISGAAAGTISGDAAGTISGTAAGTAAGTISGDAAGAAAGTISGAAAGTAAGTISGDAAGTISGGVAGTAAVVAAIKTGESNVVANPGVLAVVFGVAFAGAPKVVASLTSGPATACRVDVSTILAAGFTLTVLDSAGAGVDCSVTPAVVEWIAVYI